MRRTLVLAMLAACGGPAVSPSTPLVPPSNPEPVAARRPLPRPEAPPPFVPRKLLAIDWDRVPASTDAEALAIWATIAPTGADWEDKVDEIPSDKPVAHALAIALLREGNFACPAAAHACHANAFDVEPAKPDAGLGDPCVRRHLAQWAIEQLEPGDLPAIRPALEAIIAIPPPESELVAAAMDRFPESAPADRLAIMLAAWRSGHRDLVAATIGTLDEAGQDKLAAAHVDPAIEVLPPNTHRKTFIAAISDEALATKTRVAALVDLAATVDDAAPLPAEIGKAIVAATSAKDCTVAASAARVLDARGDHRFVPKRTGAMRTEAQMLRAMCVLASWEEAADNSESSLLPGYVGKDGIERVDIAYDPASESDDDHDGDPHTVRTSVRIPRADVVLPETADLVRAMPHCTGNTCVSDEHEFKFVWRMDRGTLVLAKLEVWERPPCT